MNIVSYNGKILDNRDCISVYNPSFLYGINCFEGLRAYWSQSLDKYIFLDFEHHLERLFDSSRRLKLSHNILKEDISRGLIDLTTHINSKEFLYIRLTLFLDGETSWAERGNVSYLISARSMPSSLNGDYKNRNYSLFTSTYLRNSEFSTPPSIKAGANYLNSRYAKLEAIEKGFDDALILNQDGFVSESTGSCIFFVKNGKLITPSLDCDILPSITRRRIIKLCETNNIEVLEGRLKKDKISDMDGAFLCGSMIEIMPVSQIDNTFMSTNELKVFHRVVDLFKNSIHIENI